MTSHGITFVKSEDKEFDKNVKITMISMFVESYNASGSITSAMKVIEDNPILRVKGFIQAINELAPDRRIPSSIVKQINELYPEHIL